MDIFQQCKILDGGETFGANWFAFRARYFRDRNIHMPKTNYFPNWQPMNMKQDGVDAIGSLNELLGKVSMRVEKQTCIDLPEEVNVTVGVGMSADQAKHYKEMKNDLITYLGDRACVAQMALTKALRLLQITSGFLSVLGDDGQVIHAMNETPKITALKEMLNDITQDQKAKILLWGVWRQDFELFRKIGLELKLGLVEVNGSISQAAKNVAVDNFRNNPDIRILAGHPGSAGIGLNLIESAYSIFYSRNFSLEQYLQARARNYRGGSIDLHKKVTHYDLVVADTIDSLCLEKLANKVDLSASLLANLGVELQNQNGDKNGLSEK